MALAVHFTDVVSLQGGFPVLAGASLEVPEGVVAHLRGPNGAGKTSLLRALAGLIPITSGQALVLGRDVAADPQAVRREVGMLSHASFLYEELTVSDNVVFALRAARAPIGRAEGAIARLGLEGRLASTRVGRLSAGQRRRCALAVLLARAPRLWLLDEPHAGLDTEGQALVDSLVAEARLAGVTVVLASHDHERVAPVADLVVDIVGGRVSLATTRERADDDGLGAVRDVA